MLLQAQVVLALLLENRRGMLALAGVEHIAGSIEKDDQVGLGRRLEVDVAVSERSAGVHGDSVEVGADRGDRQPNIAVSCELWVLSADTAFSRALNCSRRRSPRRVADSSIELMLDW